MAHLPFSRGWSFKEGFDCTATGKLVLYRILFRKLRISESKISFSASFIVLLESYFLTCCSCMFRFLTLSFNVSWSSRQCTSHWKVFSIILAACTNSMVCLNNFFITNCERRALDSGASGPGWSSGRGYCVVFLGKTLNSHSASLHPGVYSINGCRNLMLGG